MTFLFPLGLLALLAIPIIVVLHLLRERRRRVVVPSLMHWLNVPRRRDAQRVRRLPLTLLLLLHLLAAALIALALGRPQLAGVLGGARQLAVVLDTSTSMAARDGAATRFAQAQGRARALLRGLAAGDRAVLIAAGPAARVVAAGEAADAAGLLAALDALQPGGTGADIPGALALAQASLDGARRREIVVLTDDGPSGANAALPAAVAADLSWQAVGAAQPNRALVALAARPWGANVQVYARVANYSSAPFATALTLFADDRPLGVRQIALAADGETELTWTLPAGAASLRAAFDGQDALPEDDEARLRLSQARPLAVRLVSDRPDVLRRALAAIPGARVAVLAPAEYRPAVGADAPGLTVFDGFLPPEWPTGAILAVNPPPGGALDVAGDARPASGPLVRHGALFDGLSLDGVSFGPLRQLTPPEWAAPLLEQGGAPLIVRGRTGGHEIAIWAFDPAATSLPSRLAFPLLVARSVRDLAPPPLPQSLLAGAALALRPDARATELRLRAPDGSAASLPAAPQLTLDRLTQPGVYQIDERAGDATLYSGYVAVNAGAAIESDLRPRPVPAIASAAISPQAPARPQARDLWPWLALGALALLLLEWGYIHR